MAFFNATNPCQNPLYCDWGCLGETANLVLNPDWSQGNLMDYYMFKKQALVSQKGLHKSDFNLRNALQLLRVEDLFSGFIKARQSQTWHMINFNLIIKDKSF